MWTSDLIPKRCFVCNGFIVKVLPEVFVFIDVVLTVVTQTGDSLSRGWMPRDGERCGD